MNKRKAIAISVSIHALLFTALAIYWMFPAPTPPEPPQGPVIAIVQPPPKPPEPPKPEPEKPKPPIRQAENPRPSTVEPTPFTPDPEPREFAGPIDPDVLDDPPSPMPINRVSPAYPRECLDDGLSGAVNATLTIAPNGEVIDVEIISATKNCFAREARKALKRWRYPAQLVTPASTGSNRQVTVEVVFDLEDAK
jgi:periplasmic protein TonB